MSRDIYRRRGEAVVRPLAVLLLRAVGGNGVSRDIYRRRGEAAVRLLAVLLLRAAGGNGVSGDVYRRRGEAAVRREVDRWQQGLVAAEAGRA